MVCMHDCHANEPTHMLQVVFCLALPLLLCQWLDARSRRQFRLQAAPAAVAQWAGLPDHSA
jgi:hypothetical protein